MSRSKFTKNKKGFSETDAPLCLVKSFAPTEENQDTRGNGRVHLMLAPTAIS